MDAGRAEAGHPHRHRYARVLSLQDQSGVGEPHLGFGQLRQRRLAVAAAILVAIVIGLVRFDRLASRKPAPAHSPATPTEFEEELSATTPAKTSPANRRTSPPRRRAGLDNKLPSPTAGRDLVWRVTLAFVSSDTQIRN